MEVPQIRLKLGGSSEPAIHPDSCLSVGSSKSDKADQEQPTQTYVLPKLVACSIVAALENATDGLTILGNMMDLPKVRVDLDYKTLEEKYSEPFREHIFDPETLETCEEAMEKEKKMKFHRDRTYLERLLREVCVELFADRSFDKLKKRLDDHYKGIEDEEALLRTTAEIEAEVEHFRRYIDEERVAMANQIQTTTENIGTLKDEFEKLAFENEVKLHYIQKWQTARNESNSYKLDVKEDAYSDVIREKNNAIDREARIHAEIETFLSETTQEYEDGTLMWMDRYEKEMEQLETDVQILKDKREEQFERMEALSQEYEKRTQEINDYLVVREIRLKEQERLAEMEKAAIKIQAWWRGVMVRKCLGPFRKKKGKKGKGGDKKGKGDDAKGKGKKK